MQTAKPTDTGPRRRGCETSSVPPAESRLGHAAGEDHPPKGRAAMNQTEALNYAPIRPRTREEIPSSLLSGKVQQIHDALISAAYWDEDWRWAQQQLVNFAEHDDNVVLWAVILGLGFIAVFHGEIDEETSLPILNRLKGRPALTGEVEETWAEIDHFVTRRKRGEDIDLGERLPEDGRAPGQR